MDEIIEYYAQFAEQERLAVERGQLEMLRTQEVSRRYLPPPPASILDVGGGPG